MTRHRIALVVGTIALGVFATQGAVAVPIVVSGVLARDDAVVSIPITLGPNAGLTIFTTSYGGGTNLNGTQTPRGGFEPIVSLFGPSGTFIADDGGDLVPFGKVDPATGVSGDAFLHLAGLLAGTYTLTLSEFFNYPNGNLADGFFETGQGNFTGPTCSQPNGSFLQTDLVSCPQRTAAFTVNIAANAIPEPATWTMMFVAWCALCFVKWRNRRRPTGKRLGVSV